MNLFTFAVLSLILFFGCTVSLGLSYDEEQLELRGQEKSKELTESMTNGQKAFLYGMAIGAVSSTCSASYLLMLEIMKNG